MLGVLSLLVAAATVSLPWSGPWLLGGRDSTATAPSTAPAAGPEPAPFVVEPQARFRPVAARAAARAAGPARAAGARPAGPAQAGRATRLSTVAAVPLGLAVPRLGVDAPVVGIGTTDGVLVPPPDPQTLGWWVDGAKPGAARGGALFTGHTVHTGGGALDDLEALHRGDRVTVRTAAGALDYAVSGVVVYRKATLAADAARVFSQEVPGRLVLVTCEDWNGSGYDSNVVVFAEPAT